MTASVATANHDMAMMYHYVFATAEGQMVLYHILNRVCLLDTPILATCELDMAGKVAARNLGLLIKSLATAPLVVSRPIVVMKKEPV